MYVFTKIIFKTDFWVFFYFCFLYKGYIEAKFSNLIHVSLCFAKLCLSDTVKCIWKQECISVTSS